VAGNESAITPPHHEQQIGGQPELGDRVARLAERHEHEPDPAPAEHESAQRGMLPSGQRQDQNDHERGERGNANGRTRGARGLEDDVN